MEQLKAGFYTALGTPLDKDGNVVEASLRREIDMQIEAGASGLLLMGSMGMQASVKLDAWAKAAKIAADAAKGRVPLFVGVMDNAISKVKERLNLISGLNIYGVVLTAPFYDTASNSELEKFFSDVSDASEYPLFLYDLPVVTKVKITYPLVEGLIKKGKIRGIKTGDIVLARQLYQFQPDFEVLYSNIDSFDVAMAYGIDKVLDGMFSCTPTNAKGFIDAYFAGNKNESSKYLNNIISLRDALISFPPSALLYLFSEVMNGLGMEGIFCTDYQYVPNAEHAEKIKEIFRQYGEKC